MVCQRMTSAMEKSKLKGVISIARYHFIFYYLFIYLFLAAPLSMQDPSSPTRDGTCRNPCI